MKVNFLEDRSLKEKEVIVEVKACLEDEEVDSLISFIKKFKQKNKRLLPVKSEDRIFTIKTKNIIKIEVQGTELTYYLPEETIKTKGRLYQVLDKLNMDFVQVSRHAIVNINYLESLEAGFVGNMIAKLDYGYKAEISRRYMKDLEKRLGL
ncbi:LytTR family DNA-binding domain-containing protein [Lactobacillus sp. LL6]|uniref:LytTR family DNA-binding domain-containing protein n=1 Tax=Lactobacillus sp. LL6 TaxID=2596827 RepID=UPI0011859EA2|nr:LytTR family DNA-binding domain-containing protein [Lactobacillus sp. LL6]TSO26453.1 LytTR family transcriptional regulator [Lactobacillus sp. LL6]